MNKLLLIAATALIATACALPLEPETPWTENPTYKAEAAARKHIAPKKWTLNLDLAPEDRWTEIGKYYAKDVSSILEYIQAYIPKWAMPIVETIGAKLDNYKGFGDYGAELKGYSKALGVPLGDLVFASFIYQLEHIGINCTARNTTGPCPSDVAANADESGIVYPFKRPGAPSRNEGPQGLCTSFVAQAEDGSIWHGRNMDWNLPESLRALYIDVDFQRANKTVFTATTVVGYVGAFDGIKNGAFSYSMDARQQGGIILENLLEMIVHGAELPSQHARRCMEESSNYEEFVKAMSSKDLADPIYYIVAGANPGEGAVISRDRNTQGDLWSLNTTANDGWFRLETNYDHWEPVPSYDNRRAPGNAHVKAVGPKGMNATSVFNIMTEWPTFNHHTDLTVVAHPKTGVYNSMYWTD